ncbi:hypothetical protein D3C76_1575120 [compost metagenome]
MRLADHMHRSSVARIPAARSSLKLAHQLLLRLPEELLVRFRRVPDKQNSILKRLFQLKTFSRSFRQPV